MKRKLKGRKEEIAEDCCFICKDGGSLRICDEKGCLKAYHPQCVNRDDSFLETDDHWACGRHYCSICRKASKFQCFCCPYAVCRRRRCTDVTEFFLVKVKKGFCSHCLAIATLIETNKDVNSDGEKVDFDDLNTYEYMFKAYWPIIKQDENLTPQHVTSATNLLKGGKNRDFGSKSNESDAEDTSSSESSQDEGLSDASAEWKSASKRKRPPHKKTPSFAERKMKSKFNGWGSELLIEFLSSIGRDTTEKLSEFDVSAIITEYCREKKLFDRVKKKKAICNSQLERLLGKKWFFKNSLYKLVSKHLAENLEPSDDDFEWSSEDRDENVHAAASNTKPKEKSAVKRLRVEENASLRLNCFAAIVPRNLKHVYLSRSLVEILSKHSEDFENKLTGSYVRVRSDPNDYLQRNSHMLVQVSGLLRHEETKSEILLKVSNMVDSVSICKLSDDDFSEKECEDLLRRMKSGWPKLPTVVELEDKAISLHLCITKHWIEKDIVVLQKRMNQANEKGWRREFQEYMDHIHLLQTESEQSRLLSELPEIIAHVEDLEPALEDSPKNDNQKLDFLQRSDPIEVEIPKIYTKNKEMSANLNAGRDAAGIIPTPDFMGEKDNVGKNFASPKIQGFWLSRRKHSTGNCSKEQEQALEVKYAKEMNKTASIVNLIELSSDDDDDDLLPPTQAHEDVDVDSCIWFCIMPLGFKVGPYALSLLKEWRFSTSREVKFKIFRIGQNSKDAISLDEAIHKYFP